MAYCPCLDKENSTLTFDLNKPNYVCGTCFKYNPLEGSDYTLYKWVEYQCEQKYKTQIDVFKALRGILSQLKV